jgi:hypothetical protein
MVGRSFIGGRNPPPPPAPSQAAAFGLTRCAFFDDFTTPSSVDANNTGAPGYNWYAKNTWPNAPGLAGAQWRAYPPTPAANLSVANSVLTIASDWVGGFSMGLSTAASAQNGAGYIGTAFNGAMYLEATFAFDPALAAGQGQWPAWWAIPLEFIAGTVGLGNPFIELDCFEALPGSGSINPIMSLHEWTTQAGSFTNTQATNNSVNLSGADLTQFHKYGTLYIPAASNGGTGLIRRYFDNAHLSNDVTFSPTGPATPGASPTNPNGTFSIVDSQHLTLILGAGQNWPIHVDSVAVWQ